jgi:ribose transport system substrate-binding protein
MTPTRRDLIALGAGLAGGAALARYAGQEGGRSLGGGTTAGGPTRTGREEYVWLSAHRTLPLFVANDHPALEVAGRELGARVTIAGPDTVDIPGLVAAVEQTAARRPTGMMVVGWDAAALIPSINKAVDAGVPVICVDADVPKSKRAAFVGTDWYDIGVKQAEAMLAALRGRRGKVALLGLIDQSIDLQAFDGFRSVAVKAGLTVMEPYHDKGNQAEATKVAAGLLQAHPDLVGMAGFDSESGPGMGQAIKEAGKAGQIVATCVEAMEQHLRLLREGVLTACVRQKRALFTYLGVKVLDELAFPRVSFTADDKALGINPVAEFYYTGSFLVTRENAHIAGKG